MLHHYTPLCTVLQSRLQGQNIRLNNLLCLNCIIKLLILSQPQYDEVEIYAVDDETYVLYLHPYNYVHEIIRGSPLSLRTFDLSTPCPFLLPFSSHCDHKKICLVRLRFEPTSHFQSADSQLEGMLETESVSQVKEVNPEEFVFDSIF